MSKGKVKNIKATKKELPLFVPVCGVCLQNRKIALPLNHIQALFFNNI